MEHDELVVGRERKDVVEGEPARRSVHEPASRDEGRGLSQPRRIPERPHLAARLIPGARAPVEAVERRGVQEQSLQHGFGHEVTSVFEGPTGVAATEDRFRPLAAGKSGVGLDANGILLEAQLATVRWRRPRLRECEVGS
jgi:hypothetical protein